MFSQYRPKIIPGQIKTAPIQFFTIHDKVSLVQEKKGEKVQYRIPTSKYASGSW